MDSEIKSVDFPLNDDYNFSDVSLKFKEVNFDLGRREAAKEKIYTVNLLQFMEQKIGLKSDGKKYKCIHCDKTFDRAAALGGHTSKNHPSKSRNYKKRIFSSNVRKVE